MAGDRNTEPAPWERAARQGGDDWYGGRETGGRFVDQDDDEDEDSYLDKVPEPRRSRSAGRSSASTAAAGAGRARGGSGSGGSGGGTRGGKSTSSPRFGPKAIVTASTASLLATVVGAGAFTYAHYSGSINTFADAGSANRPQEAAKNAQGQSPENILLIGSDARDNGNNVYGGGATGQGARSDTSILLHVYADHQHAVGISIPRDMEVDIPACLYDSGKPNGKQSGPQHAQFNVAFAVGDSALGNPVCERNTIEQLSGIRIDHTVIVGFAAFAQMTDAIGGVQVCVPKAVGPTNGDNISLKAGIQVVEGQSALDYVRKRDGLGDGSDIGRTRRQQAFLGSMIKKIESDGVLNDPNKLSSLLNSALKYVTFDPGLGTIGALSQFADSMKGIKPANVQFMTLPGHYAGARVDFDPVSAKVIWDHLKADQLLDGSDASGSGATTASAPVTVASTTAAPPPPTTAPAIPPSSIAVRVLNGTTTTGLAANATNSLTAQGYNAVVSHAQTRSTAVTTIVYGYGKEAQAKQLATLYPGAKVESGGSSSTLVLTLGSDYAASHVGAVTTPPGVSSSGSAAAPGTTSAAPLPSAIANNSRNGDTGLCDGITQGFGAGTG